MPFTGKTLTVHHRFIRRKLCQTKPNQTKPKPKRTLVQIRSEKAALADQLNAHLQFLNTLSKQTPHEFLARASYNEVLNYKDCAQKCQNYWLNSKGSANILTDKIKRVTSLIAELQKYIKPTHG